MLDPEGQEDEPRDAPPIRDETLDLDFATATLARDMSEDRHARKRWGTDRAGALRRPLDDLVAAATREQTRSLPGRCEALTGDRAGTFSVRLDKNYRLIFEPADDPIPLEPDGGIERARVTRIRILEVVDYHGST